MVACCVKLILGPDTEWEAQRIANIFNALLAKEQPKGFHGYTFLFNYETGEYKGLSMWDNADDAMAGVIKYMPLLNDMTRFSFQCEPTVELYDVYEPKAIEIDVD